MNGQVYRERYEKESNKYLSVLREVLLNGFATLVPRCNPLYNKMRPSTLLSLRSSSVTRTWFSIMMIRCECLNRNRSRSVPCSFRKSTQPCRWNPSKRSIADFVTQSPLKASTKILVEFPLLVISRRYVTCQSAIAVFVSEPLNPCHLP